jgi:hypothetical protein
MSSQSQSYITTDGQPASLSWNKSTHLGLTTRSWLLSDSSGFVGLGRPLWREDGSAVCNCYWSSPAQSFSGPSPVGLVAVFYTLTFDTSLFVASYDSQGHGGGIRPRLHTGDSVNYVKSFYCISLKCFRLISLDVGWQCLLSLSVMRFTNAVMNLRTTRSVRI